MTDEQGRAIAPLATLASGCRACSAAWDDTQLVFRAADQTWWTTCPRCGHRQRWAWVR